METCVDNLVEKLVEKLEIGRDNKLEILKSIFEVVLSNENINVDFELLFKYSCQYEVIDLAKHLINNELVRMEDIFKIMKKHFHMEVVECLQQVIDSKRTNPKYPPRERLENIISLTKAYAKNGKIDAVKFLVEKNNIHRTRLAHILPKASANGHLKVVMYLVSQGIYFEGYYGEISLISAARNGHLQVVMYWISQKVNIHAYDDEAYQAAAERTNCVCPGRSPHGHLEVVEYLVCLGANIYCRSGQVLMTLVRNRSTKIIKFLLSYGVKEQSKNEMLISAAYFGRLKIVKLLLSHGAKTSFGNHCVLTEAVRGGNLEIVEHLVENSNNFNFNGGYQMIISLINIAMKKNNLEIVKYLAEKGIELKDKVM